MGHEMGTYSQCKTEGLLWVVVSGFLVDDMLGPTLKDGKELRYLRVKVIFLLDNIKSRTGGN